MVAVERLLGKTKSDNTGETQHSAKMVERKEKRTLREYCSVEERVGETRYMDLEPIIQEVCSSRHVWQTFLEL